MIYYFDLDFLCSLGFVPIFCGRVGSDSESFDLINLSFFILSWMDRRISQLFLNFTKNLMAKYPPNTDMIAMKILDASLV